MCANNQIVEKSILTDNDVLSKESEEGMYEYKWKLVGVSEERFKHLVSQLKYRLGEGQGEAVYEIGISDQGIPIGLEDNEFNETLDTLRKMAAALSADVSIICEKSVTRKKDDVSAFDLIKQASSTYTTNTTSLPANPHVDTFENPQQQQADASLPSLHGLITDEDEQEDKVVVAADKKTYKVGEVLIRKFGNEQYMDIR